MADDIQVDIIIVTWNRPDETIDAIASALAQTGVRRRVLVVDQGSEPANIARVKAYCADRPDVTLKCLDSNVGIAEGRNVAIAMGTAPIVVGIDNDAVFTDAGCVARAAVKMDADGKLGVIAFRILDFDTKEEEHWDYPEPYRANQVDSFEVTRFLGGGHAMRRSAFDRTGGYDAALFFIGEERDIAWRVINAGYRIRWFRDLAVLHHPRASQKVTWGGRRFYLTVRNTLYINYKFGDPPWRLAQAVVGFVLRGIYNHLGFVALEGVLAGIGMMWRFTRTSTNKPIYRLAPEIRRYIDETDMKHKESILRRLRRQFTPLPGY